MSQPTTPAGIRAKQYMERWDHAEPITSSYDGLAQAILDMDRPLDLTSPGEVTEMERLLGAGMKAEWGHFMQATDEAWVKKARGIIARMFDASPGGEKSVDYMDYNVGAVDSWAGDWADTYVGVHELPFGFPSNEIGAEVYMESPGPHDQVVKITFRLAGQTRHSIGFDRPATRLDLVADDGRAYPLRRACKVLVNGAQVWPVPVEDPLDVLDPDWTSEAQNGPHGEGHHLDA